MITVLFPIILWAIPVIMSIWYIFFREKIGIINVFDISLSMLAEDIQPSRIEVAKTIIKNFIRSRTDDRIGLIIFAGKPFIQSSFSTDYRGIINIVD